MKGYNPICQVLLPGATGWFLALTLWDVSKNDIGASTVAGLLFGAYFVLTGWYNYSLWQRNKI